VNRAFEPLALLMVGFTLTATPAHSAACTRRSGCQPLVTGPSNQAGGFKPAVGSAVTVGYTPLGSVEGVSVDVRELRDTKGAVVRGLVVEVKQGEYREERAFVDADELDELVRGLDAVLAVKNNPTSFSNFEVRYTTRGDLELTAFNSSPTGEISYTVQAGRGGRAQAFLAAFDMQKLRDFFVAAQSKLAAK
jgi:hypothetical protein